jgi:hypothetical protein
MTHDFDWVTARAKCSLSQIFEELKAEVRHDVEIRKAMLPSPPQPSAYTFTFKSTDHTFTVLLEGHKLHKTVEFSLEATAIAARANGKIIWSAGVELNEEGRCMLRINNQNYEHWQARKMALSDLFFAGLPNPDWAAQFGGHSA